MILLFSQRSGGSLDQRRDMEDATREIEARDTTTSAPVDLSEGELTRLQAKDPTLEVFRNSARGGSILAGRGYFERDGLLFMCRYGG